METETGDDPGNSRSDRARAPSWSNPRDAVAFAEQLAELTRSGMPLDSGLRALSAEIPSKRLKRSLIATADQIEAGVSLERSVTRQGSDLPGYLQGLILAGIRSGALADVLAEFVRYRTIGQDLRRQFWVALSYPLVLFTLVGLLLIFVMNAIVLSFEAVMKDFGLQLPLVTVGIFRITHFVLDYGPMLLMNLVLLGLLLFVAAWFLLDAAGKRRILMAVPVAGSALRFGSLAEFCHLLGTLVDVRMPLPDALELASNAVNDPTLAAAGKRIKAAIDQGHSFENALQNWTDCPPGLSEMLAWAEKHRNLADSLHLAGEMYEARARSQAGFASVLFGTLTLIVVVFGVGITILSMYLPMISLISKLSG